MDSDEECPELVPLPAQPSPSSAATGRKIPVTIITGFLGQLSRSCLIQIVRDSTMICMHTVRIHILMMSIDLHRDNLLAIGSLSHMSKIKGDSICVRLYHTYFIHLPRIYAF